MPNQNYAQQCAKALVQAEKNFPSSLEKLSEFIRIPSVSTKEAHKKDCQKAAQWLQQELQAMGFQTDLHPAPWAAPGHPFVLGEAAETENTGAPSLLFYGHYDVQPAEPLDLWDSPPFEPVQRKRQDGLEAVFGRGSSDDKGQLLTFVEACRAWKEANGAFPLPLKFLAEGEEEIGGENLPHFLETQAEYLKTADLVLVCDTSMVSANQPSITSSLRGLVGEEVTITCANQDLHSGLFGGAAANPAAILCKALAGLRDDTGRITLKGFYDNILPPTPAQKEQWKTIEQEENGFLKEVGLSVPFGEKNFSALEQLWARPTCEINGFSSGYTEKGFKTIIPAQANAKISFRTVPGQNPAQIREAFRAHIKSYLPPDAKVAFQSHGASPGWAFPQDVPALKTALKALSEEWETEAVAVGCGASIPVAEEVERKLGLPALLIGFALAEDRIHSPNESYAITSYQKGIRSWIRLLAAFAQMEK